MFHLHCFMLNRLQMFIKITINSKCIPLYIASILKKYLKRTYVELIEYLDFCKSHFALFVGNSEANLDKPCAQGMPQTKSTKLAGKVLKLSVD